MTKPTLTPPDEALTTDPASEAQPSAEFLLVDEDLASTDGASEPSMAMSEEDAVAQAGADEEALTAGTWHSGKKVSQLWTINQDRNSWANISGVGWRKLANNSFTGNVALTMLAAHAKQANRNANLRENKSKIEEIYVW